ncbi:MAG: PilZ domain-containing protein [Deltaproteobacteria bacterium]|nr:PilZ domain-containing protein [Deltaproteobacteria bacterium]
MEDKDRIYGKQRFALFDQLQKDRVVIKLNLLGKDYERLTIITGVVTENGTPYVLIDIPGEFRETLQDDKKGRVLFDFIGNDRIPCSFRTVVHRITKDDIWLEFPESIERIQRRKHYRIAPPIGTRIHFQVDEGKYEANIVNLSQGGALIIQSERLHKEVKLSEGEYKKNVKLICQEKDLGLKILIKKALVRRILKNSETGKYSYALQFIDIENSIQRELNDWIYRAQREFLRKRNLL